MSNWIPIKLAEQSIAVRDAEIAELKAELRKRAIDSISDIGQLGELSAENVHLKEENGRLNAEVTNLKSEADRLKAEVERLRKAGDAVCESPYLLETDPAVIAWRAAKEGKQP